MTRVPITREGYNELLKALERLRNVERPRITAEIEAARAHGDLSENAEYHAAKERQGHLEGKIRELESKLGESDIIEITRLPEDRVVFGSVVLLENLETGEKAQYRLVGPHEADIKKHRLSVTSPIGKAVIGRTPGDVVTVHAPGGKKEYELVAIVSD
jgi:transcription elongation factor GreA